MADGTNVGSIFLDLIVRDTVKEQVKKMVAGAQETAKQALSGVEKAAEKMASNVTVQTGKATQQIAENAAKASQKAASSMVGTINRSVAMAQAGVTKLEREIKEISSSLDALNAIGFTNTNSSEVNALVAAQEKAMARLEMARTRLNIELQAAAQKRVVAEEKAAAKAVAAAERARLKQEESAQKAAAVAEKAALKQAMEAQRAAEKAAVAAKRAAAKREAAERKVAEAAQKAAQKAAAAEEKASSRRKAIHASMWKNMLSKAADGAKAIVGKLSWITKGYNRSGGAARRFGSRLREIASGALIFNGISAAMRSMVSYFSKSIASTDQMKGALANLKGAAANAASPIIQVLTPALSALANMAATVLSYVSRLVTMLTGKVSNAAATAAKSAQTAAGAAQKASRSLAGFDQIERLGSDSSSSGGGSSEEIAPNYDFEGKSPFLESVLSSIQAGQWGQVGALIAQKLNSSLAAIQWPSIQEKAQQWTQNLVDTLNGFGTNLNWELVGSSIGEGLNTILTSVDTFCRGIKWKELGKGLGTGLDSLFKTVNWEKLAAGITSSFTGIFDGITAFITNVDWKDLGNKVAECIKGIDWNSVVDSFFGGISAALEGLAAFLCGLLEDAWSSVVDWWYDVAYKDGEFTMDGLLEGIWNVICDIGSWLWDHVVKPIIDGVKAGFGIHSPSTVFADIGKNLILGLLEGISGIWERITGFFETAISKLVAKVSNSWDKIVTWTKKAWEKIVKVWEAAPEWFDKNIVQPVTDFFSDLWEVVSELGADAWEKIKQTWDDVSAWFNSNVIRPVQEYFSQLWSNISGYCENAWSKIKQIWQSVASWFDTNVIQPIAGFFSNLWTKVTGFCETAWTSMQETWKSVSVWFKNNVVDPITNAFKSVYDGVSTIWNDLIGFIKGAINGIIGLINGMLRGLAAGVNGLIGVLNKISVKLPNWKLLGDQAGQTFGFKIPTVSAPQISYLASGGVIKQPTLAMMGEYSGASNNPEIVTPQSLMAETVAAVMEDVVASNVAGFEAVVAVLRDILEAVLGIEIGDDVFGQAVARYNRKMAVVKGGM